MDDVDCLFFEMWGKGLLLDVIIYNVFFNFLGRGGWFKEVCKIFEDMKESGFFFDVVIYDVFFLGFLKIKEVDDVCGLLKELIE